MRNPNLTSIAARICFSYLPLLMMSMLISIQLKANPVADIIPPVLDCPGTISIQLLPGECESVIIYNVTATDNLDPNPVVSQINGLASGSAFPIGTTTIDYQAVDAAGNASTCTFDVIVNEYDNGTTLIDCQAIVNLALDQNCQGYITPAYILQGQYGCFDKFTVSVVDANGQPVPQLIDGTYLGQTLTISVTEIATGTTCTGDLFVYDHSAPILSCQDQAVYCYDGTTPGEIAAQGLIGYPTVTDNCDSNPTLTYIDVTTPLDCAIPTNGGYYLSQIERTWTATDAAGHSNTCMQTIYSRRSFVYEIECPKNADNIKGPALDCNDDPTDFNITGQPLLNGVPVNELNTCNLSASYTDSIANICGSSYRIYRTWTMVDLCPDGEVVYEPPYFKGIIEKVQVIDFLDTNPPTFTCPDSLTTGTDPASCEGMITLPAVSYTDDCSNVEISTITPDGIVHDGNGGQVLTNLAVGNYTVIYVAKDDCGNISTCNVPVIVNDYIAPQVQCSNDLTFSLNNSGVNEICYTDLDAGSTDNCSDLTYQIRRSDAPYGSPFTDCVYYDCSDAGASFQIELIVTDASGNDDNCIVNITIADDVAPSFVCPVDVSIDCSEDYTDLLLTGGPTAGDLCGVGQINHSDNIVIGTCGLDTIFRTWTVVDHAGNSNSCIQQIVQINTNPFFITDTDASNANPNDGVEWPANYNLLCGNSQTDILPASLPSTPVNYAQPKLHFGHCDAVSMSYVDSLITGSVTGCYSVARTWYVRDWCQYDASDLTIGLYDYVQLISLTDNVPPTFTSVCEDVTVCNYDASCGLTFAHLEVEATDDCSADADLNYFYAIDLHDDGTINANGTGSSIDDLYPVGKHKVTFEVGDGCGNISTCSYYFEIVDCVKPTADCKLNVTINLNANGEYNLTSAEIESGASTDNCTNYNDLIFSFSNNPAEQTFLLNCAYLGSYNLELWVTDLHGNQSKCSTTIYVEDSADYCSIIPPPSNQVAEIAGYIQNEAGTMIENVEVAITNAIDYTDVSGDYNFPNLPIGSNYTVTPNKVTNLLNGVTTLDLVLITRHILGIQLLQSPYKMIAADVNNSSSISTLDVVNLQRVILGIDPAFNNNNSWRFVDMDYVFPITTNPFAYSFPEVISYNNIQADELAADFIAVKIGDVNSSAAPNLVGSSQARNNTPFNFEVKNEFVEAGSEYIIEINSKDSNGMLGYQLSLQLDQDKVEILEVTAGELEGMTNKNFGLSQMDRGMLTANWYTATAIQSNESKHLFNIKIRAKSSFEINEVLQVATAPTIDLAVKEEGTDLIEMPIELTFSQPIQQAAMATISSSPNPFKESATISFHLEAPSEVELNVIDLNGRVVLIRQGNFETGQNQMVVTGSELNETGVYYYQIKTNTYTVTEKMIFVD